MKFEICSAEKSDTSEKFAYFVQGRKALPTFNFNHKNSCFIDKKYIKMRQQLTIKIATKQAIVVFQSP